MHRIGIEKINIYGGSLLLDQKKLAEARGMDPQKVVADFLIDTRSLNPLYEDTVTMGANAAAPILTDEDTGAIGMLVVGTESSVDFGKPISTNIHGALGLSSRVRNFETKHACYSGVAALDTALNWIASGLNRGRKALVISSDFSRMHLNAKEEFVLGGVAAAVLVSDNPKVVEYELQKKGTWTTHAYDTFRPSARHEMGNNEVSLYTYLDALEGAYRDYVEATGEAVDFDAYFSQNCYHTPFPGMAFQAHRTLCNLARARTKVEIRDSFTQKVQPSLRFARRVGSTYGASNFLGICGIAMGAPGVKAGDRISFFSYGSGAIGEFYSGILCPEAREVVSRMRIDEELDARRGVSVEEYETIEKTREQAIEQSCVTPDFSLPTGWYDTHYRGKKRLVLREVKDFQRIYEWSERVALVDQYQDSHVSVITLNDAEHGNLLGPAGLDALAAAFERSKKDPLTRAVLLRSNGPSFCLGMDLGRLASAPQKASAPEAEAAVSRYARILHSIFALPLPVVCLVQGEVKAGGVGLACACDIVVAGEGASFELGEVIFGLIPANVLPYVLSLRMPPQKARYLVLSSRRVSAAEALRLNMVDEVVPDAQAEHRLRDIFKRLLCSSPRALAAAKEFTAELIGKTPEQGGALARGRLLELMRDPSTLEGVRAFQEGETPAWFARFRPQRPLTGPERAAEKEAQP